MQALAAGDRPDVRAAVAAVADDPDPAVRDLGVAQAEVVADIPLEISGLPSSTVV